MTSNLFASSVTTVIGLVYLITALKYNPGSLSNPGPGLFPRILGSTFLLCSLILLFASWRNRDDIANSLSKLFTAAEKRNMPKLVASIISVAAYILLVDYAGFLITSSVFVAVFGYLMGGRNWLRNIILGIGTGLSFYWLFWVVMRVPLPLGKWGW